METQAAQFAREIGVNPQQRMAYDLRGRAFSRLRATLETAVDEEQITLGLWEIRGLDTYAAILTAATALGPRRREYSDLWRAAMGLSRSIGTARLCPVAASRVKAYRPWVLCALLGRIVAEVPVLSTAAVDEWLRAHREEL